MTVRLATILYILMPLLLVGFDARAEEYVAIPGDAWLRADPGSKEIRYRKGGDYLQYGRILDERDGWLKVDLGPNDSKRGHCVPAYEVYPMQLAMWVRENDVAKVTTNTVTWKADDGTWISVRPGLPVKKQGDRYESMTRHGWVLPIEPGALGSRYQPKKPPKLDTDFRRAKGDFQIGGKRVANTDDAWFPVVREIEIDGKRRFEVSQGCVRALVDGELERPDPDKMAGILGSLTGAASEQKYWEVQAETPVYWSTGKRAGKVRRTWITYSATKRGERLCGKVGDYAPGGGLELCVAADAATEKTAPKLGEAFGGGFGIGGLGLSDDSKKTLKGQNANPDAKLSKDEIRKTIQSRNAQVKACFVTALENKPKLSGKIKVEMAVREDGTVATAKAIEDSVQDTGMRKCLLGEMKSLKFRAAKGRGLVVVKYPFVFK